MDITNQSKCKSPARDMSKMVLPIFSISLENASSVYNIITKSDSEITDCATATVCG